MVDWRSIIQQAADAAPVQTVNGETGDVTIQQDQGVVIQDRAETFEEADVTVTEDSAAVYNNTIGLFEELGETSRPADTDVTGDPDNTGLVINPNENLDSITATVSQETGTLEGVTIIKTSDGTQIGTTSGQFSAGDRVTVQATETLQPGTEYSIAKTATATGIAFGYIPSPAYPFTGSALDIVSGCQDDGTVKNDSRAPVFNAIAGNYEASEGRARVEWDQPDAISQWDRVAYGTTPEGESISVRAVFNPPEFLRSDPVSAVIILGLGWDSGGNNLYVSDTSNGLKQIPMGTPFSIPTAQSSTAFLGSGNGTGDPDLNNDDTRIYVPVGARTGVIKQYDLSTPSDLNTASSAGQISAAGDFISSLRITDDGTQIWTAGFTQDVVVFDLSTPFDITSATQSGSISTGINPRTLVLGESGEELIVANEDRGVKQFTMSTPYDPSTAQEVHTASLTGGTRCLATNNDGSKLYNGSSNSSEVYVQRLNAPYSVLGDTINDLPNNGDISSVPADKQLFFDVVLSRQDFTNRPTLDAIYRQWKA